MERHLAYVDYELQIIDSKYWRVRKGPIEETKDLYTSQLVSVSYLCSNRLFSLVRYFSSLKNAYSPGYCMQYNRREEEEEERKKMKNKRRI